MKHLYFILFRRRQIPSIVVIFLVVFGVVYYLSVSARIRANHYLNSVSFPQDSAKKYRCDDVTVPSPRNPILSEVIKDDWLVNDDTTGGCDQLEPSIVNTKNGYIAVWIDYRNGHNPDIYAGRFDFSGVLIDSVVQVNNDSGSNYQGAPSVDADSAGNFVVVWEDRRNGETDIYAQRYNKNAIPLGTNFRVNDDASGREQCTPVVGVCLDGKFMVAWRDDRGSAPDIYAQVYDDSGLPMGSNFVVNDDGLSNSFQVFPDISKAPNNEFAVTWLDTRAGIGIYCQRYTCSGIPIGSNFEVTDNSDSTAPMRYPAISSNLVNLTVVVWQDHREHDSYPNIYAQLYDSLWNTVGANFRVNDDTVFAWHDVPSVAVTTLGFVVVWNDKRNNFSNPDVYGQRYDAACNPQGANFKINEFSLGQQDFTNPVVDVDTSGNFLVAWQENLGGDRELLAQIYNQTGSPVGGNFPLIPDEGMSDQKVPEIAMNISGNFVIAWEDERGTKPVIFAQRYDSLGNSLSVNWQVNDTNKSASSASVAIDSAGNFVVVWMSAISVYEYHIYGCKYTSAGTPMTAEFQVDSGPADVKRIAPSVGMDASGNFVVVWEDYRNDSKYGDIYGQRYSADCTPVDSNFRISRIAGESSESPCVAMNEDGDFVVVWQEGRAGMPIFDIYGQRFNSSGDTVGGNFQISDAPMAQHQQIYPSLALHRDGNFVVVWQDSREHTYEIYDIYAQIYDAQGLPVDTNFRVNATTDSAQRALPSVIFRPLTKEFMVIWTDYRETNPQIIAQKFDSLGTPLGDNFQINNPDVHPCNYHLSSSRSIGSNGEEVGLVWTDNRRLKGWDIYAKLVKWEFAKAEEVISRRLLLQVYPNPAIKYLTIKYIIPYIRGPVSSIHIYDRSGRAVTEFTLPETTPGIYTTQLDVSALSSGIYFIKNVIASPDSHRDEAISFPPITQKVIICH